MVRKAQPQAITAQMYRHFAILTVAITAALALFADGESREAVAGEIAKQRPQQPGGEVGTLVRKELRPAGGGFGPDEAFGTPTDHGVSSTNDWAMPANFGGASAIGLPESYTPYGVSAATWARLTEEQRKALIARQEAEQAAAQSPERADEIESLAAASRARASQGAADE